MDSPVDRLRRLLLLVALALVASGAGADPFRALDLIRLGNPTLARDFTVPGLGSEPLRLNAFRGQVVLLNFWATWCPPCTDEMPSMERLYQRYKPFGFTILAISVDMEEAATIAPFVEALKVTFPIGLAPSMDVPNQYALRALPSSFLIDRSGNTVAIALGPRDWDGTAAHAVIEALLK